MASAVDSAHETSSGSSGFGSGTWGRLSSSSATRARSYRVLYPAGQALTNLLSEISDRGFTVIPGVVPADQVRASIDAILRFHAIDDDDSTTWANVPPE